MSEEIVRQIGRYKIVGELGRGGFGCVYRAFDVSVGRPVAVKVLTERGNDVLARFRNEAQVAGNLRHENIVTVYEYGEHEGQPFLAMEYLEGEDLQQIMASKKPLSLLEKCSIMSQAAEGLDCAHRNGVVHRDVKPANIMVRPDGHVKIMDFGIARLTQDRDATRLTQEGWLIGTLLYMAPEQFSGTEIDALCDIFAYGVIYYQLLTGVHPFEAPDARALVFKISFEDPAPIRTLMPECPEALERVIMRILSKDRELRYQSLKDVQFDTEVVRLELQRQRSVELVSKAQDLLDREQFDSAQMLVLDALGLDPSNSMARSLRESLQKRLQHRALQPRIDALVNAGDDHVGNRRFSQAIQSFEAALKLDSENTGIQERIARARSKMEHSRTAASLLADAQKEFDNNNLTLASRSVSEALRHDPENPMAAELLARIQAEIDRRQKEKRVEEAMHRAEGLVLLHSYDEAIGVLEGLGADANAPRVERLLMWLRSEKIAQERREKLQAEMAAISDLLRGRKLTEAVERLEVLRKEYPTDKETEHLLVYARRELEAEARADAIGKVVTKVGGLADSRDFNAALALLEETLKQYSGEPTLIRVLGSTMAAKASWERQQAIGNALQEGGRLREEQHFAEAIELVEATLRDYSSDPVLEQFLEQLEQDWARKRRTDAVRKAADRATSLLERKQPQEAQQYLRQAVAQFPGEESLTALLKSAEEELRAIEKQRAIGSIARETATLAAAQDFGRALELIDQGLRTWKGDAALLKLRKDTADAETEWRRRKDILTCSQAASGLAKERKFAEALELIARALRQYPGDPELARLEGEVAQEWERHKRLEAVRSIASEARLLLSRGELDEAAEVLKEGAAQYQGEVELEALSERVSEALRARERVRAIEKLIRESQELVAAHDFDGAREVVQRGLGVFPAAQALTRQMEAVKTAAGEWERQQTIAKNIAEASRMAGELRFEEALQLLGRTPPSPEVQETQRRIERDCNEFKRREAVAKGSADAETLLQNEQPEAAVKLLEQLSSRFPGEPAWEALMTRARSALALRKAAEERRRAIEEGIAECERLAREAQFEEALARAAAALKRFEEDTALLALQDRLNAAWSDQKRSQAIAQAGAEAGRLLQAGRLEDSIEYLRRRCAEYPEEATLRGLLGRAERELAERQERERILQECLALEQEQRLDDAVRTLEPALARFPGDAGLTALLARVREDLNARRRAEAIASLTQEALALAKVRKFDEALALVRQGQANWPGDQSLSELQASLNRDQIAWRREQTRRQIAQGVKQLIGGGRFTEARERAEGGLRDFPDDPELLGLRSDSRMREILAEAESAAAKGKPAEALRTLEACSAEYGTEAEWKALRDRLRDEVSALERAAAIRKRTADARALAEKLDFEGALGLLDSGLQEWPGERVLEDARRAVTVLKEAHERRRAIEKSAAECARLAEAGRLQEALTHAGQALQQFPDEPSLVKLRTRIENELQAEERRKQRQRDLDELGGLAKRIADAKTPELLLELGGIAQTISGHYPGDKEMAAAAARTNAHLADIQEAGNALSQRDFGAALEICRRYLAQYPKHYTFLGIQKDAERGRKVLDLEEIRAHAESEPDLAKRAGILEAALARYPDEAWLSSDLRFTRNKLEMADTIVSAARAHEAKGAWEEALEQWNKLATIYDLYPGLAGEIERVTAARERALADATTRWAEQVEQLIGKREYGKARDLLRRARTELPEAAPLRELERRLEGLRQKQQRVRELLTAMRGRHGGEWERLDQDAKEAIALSAGDAGLRKSVLDQLIAFASDIVDSDWRRADTWLALVRSAEPAYAIPEGLARAIAKGKKAETIEAALHRAAELQTAGNLREALAHLGAALREFPNDQQLETARQGVDRQWQDERAGIATELREIRASSERAGQSADLEVLNSRVAVLGGQVQQDAELAALAAETARAIASRRKQLGRARIAGMLGANRKAIVIAAGSAAALVAGIVAVPVILRPMRDVSVTVTSDTAGASVSAGGARCVTPQCTLKLRPGTYTLTASKDGFKPISRPLTVSGRDRESKVPLIFEPLPEELQVNTNFENGTVYVDGRTAGALRDGQFSLSAIGAGQHSVRIASGDAEFRMEWKSAPGGSPELRGPIEAKNLQAAVVANAGSGGSIECNCEPGMVLIDGSPAGRTGGAGVAAPLTQLQQGPRQIVVGGRTVVINIRPNPSLNIFLALDRNVGTLAVSAGVDNARVYLNNRLYPRRTEHGMVRIPVNVGQYSIRVEMENYRTPPAQAATVAKGEEKQVQFSLTPAPPALEISGAQPHSHVKVDGRIVGDTDGNGRIRTEVSPGRHTIEISKDGYAPARFDEQFAPAREPVRPSPALVAMVKLPAAAPPPNPEPKVVDSEPQDWARAGSSGRAADLLDYIRKHPTGAHAREAQAQLDQLQQAETNRSEQAAWDGLDKTSKTALQDFVSRHGSNPHVQEARGLLDGIQKREAAEAAAAEQKKAEQDRLAKSAADARAIERTLADFEAAFSRLDLAAMEKLYDPLPTILRDNVRDVFRSVAFQLKPTGPITVNGDSATVVCTRKLSVKFRATAPPQDISERVRVDLARSGARWVIRDIKKF
jgi:eukaryotic-like serine/threonine-protein kinase